MKSLYAKLLTPSNILLLLIVLLAYWQIAFMQYTLQWDALDCWLPWRYFIGESLHKGMLPMWNPYQQMGYPIHADLQGPAWYPESFITAFTLGHNIYSLQLLFVLYIFVGGMGIRRLSALLGASPIAAFTGAAAYMLCGFFVSHSQHFYSVISAAWMPHLLFYFIRMLNTNRRSDAVKAAMVVFLMVTGGNQTFLIIFFYLLLALLLTAIVRAYKAGDRQTITQLALNSALLTGLSLLLCTVTFVCLAQVLPHIDRLSGMSFAKASYGHLSFQGLISFLCPFAIASDRNFANTDISMANSYFGMFMLLFLIWRIGKKQLNATDKTLLVFGILCLLASFGSQTPFYKLLYTLLPGIKLFRFPSYFSYASMLCFIVIGTKGMDEAIKDNSRKTTRILFALFMLALLLLLIWAKKGAGYRSSLAALLNIPWREFVLGSNAANGTLLQGSLQLMLLALAFVIMYFGIHRRFQKVLPALVVIEMLISVQCNIHGTTALNASPKDVQQKIDLLPDGFPLPGANNVIASNSDAAASFWPLWRNTNVYHKKVSFSGFNSFWLKDNYFLFDSLPQLAKAAINNPLIYLSSELLPMSKLPPTLDSVTDRHKVFLDDKAIQNLTLPSAPLSADDTAIINEFNPGRINIQASVANSCALTLLQSHYPGWTVKVDGQEQTLLKVNKLFMAVLLPPGSHQVLFEYRNLTVMAGFAVSYFSFFALLIWLFVEHRKSSAAKSSKKIAQG